MKPEFLQVGLVFIALAHVASVDLRKENIATVILSNSNSYTFEGEDATDVALAFARLNRQDQVEPPAAAAGDVPLA